MHQDVDPTGAVALDPQRLETGHRANLRTLDALLKALPQDIGSAGAADLALAAQRLANAAARRAVGFTADD